MADTKPDGRRATLRDVAQAAGVSLKTASNVINGSGRMTPETRAKVETVIERLDYRVNVAARNLSRNRTGFITLAMPSLTQPYMSELASRTIDAARERGYSVYVTTYVEGSERGARRLLETFNSTFSDGMILSVGEQEPLDPDDLRVDFPLVVVGARSTYGAADHVTPDDIHAAAMAAGHLYDHGTTHLAIVGARGRYDEAALLRAVEGNAQLRIRGIIEESHRRGIILDPRLVGNADEDWSIGTGARVTQRLIDSGVPFDGVVALNDQLAIGVIFALSSNGLAIPADVQVIGFDNIEEAEYLQVPLSTMDSRLGWTAATAVDRILERIEARIEGRTVEPERLTTQSQVIARASTR